MISLPDISTVPRDPLSRVADRRHGGVPVTRNHDSVDGFAVRAQALSIAECGSIHMASVDDVPLRLILGKVSIDQTLIHSGQGLLTFQNGFNVLHHQLLEFHRRLYASTACMRCQGDVEHLAQPLADMWLVGVHVQSCRADAFADQSVDEGFFVDADAAGYVDDAGTFGKESQSVRVEDRAAGVRCGYQDAVAHGEHLLH